MLKTFEKIVPTEILIQPQPKKIYINEPPLSPDLMKEYIISQTQKETAKQALSLGVVPEQISRQEMEAYFTTALNALVEAQALQTYLWGKVFKDFSIEESLKSKLNVELDTGRFFYYGDE